MSNSHDEKRDWTLATATLVFCDHRGGDDVQTVIVTYSDGRDPVTVTARHRDRPGATSPDQWIDGNENANPNTLDADVLAAIGTRGNIDGSPVKVEVPSVLAADDCGGWHVTDAETGAVWWPNDGLSAAISLLDSDDAEQEVLRACIETPISGEWRT